MLLLVLKNGSVVNIVNTFSQVERLINHYRNQKLEMLDMDVKVLITIDSEIKKIYIVRDRHSQFQDTALDDTQHEYLWKEEWTRTRKDKFRKTNTINPKTQYKY